MDTVAEIDSLRRATRITYKMARQFVQKARKYSASPTMKAELLKMACAARDNARSFRAKIRVYEAS